MSDEEELRHWVYAGGLPYELTEGDVICVFSQYGEIGEFTLARDKETGKSRGFCFIKYQDTRSCEMAVDNFNGATVLGRKLKASFASNLEAIRKMKPVDVAPKC